MKSLPAREYSVDLAGAFLGEQAIAVVLELEHPARIGERLARRREHRLASRAPRARAARRRACAARCDDAAPRGSPLATCSTVRPESTESCGIVLGALRRRVRVALLDEQPLVLAALRLDERPPAAQLVAVELEQELALVEPGGDVVQRDPRAAVPDDDGAGAVVVGRDHALEVHVVDGVVLDVHGEPLVGRIRRRPLRHRPGLQHALELEPEVVVSPARGVLLHDEPLAARRARRRTAPGFDPPFALRDNSLSCRHFLLSPHFSRIYDPAMPARAFRLPPSRSASCRFP